MVLSFTITIHLLRLAICLLPLALTTFVGQPSSLTGRLTFAIHLLPFASQITGMTRYDTVNDSSRISLWKLLCHFNTRLTIHHPGDRPTIHNPVEVNTALGKAIARGHKKD